MPIKQTKIWRYFSSIRLAVWLLAMLTVFSLIGTIIPQNKEPAEDILRYGCVVYKIFHKSGLLDVFHAPWFILLLLLLALNLIACLGNRLPLKKHLLGTVIVHASILIILAGVLIGVFYGQRGYVRIFEGQSRNFFLSRNNKVFLDFSLHLEEFVYEDYINPKEKILIYDRDRRLCAAIPTEIGTESVVPGSGERVKILQYLPDFTMHLPTKKVTTRSAEPKNPAIKIQVENKKGELKTSWVFAVYPEGCKIGNGLKFEYHWMPRRPKDFLSKISIIKHGQKVKSTDIRVNSPLRFDGYTILQSSYDKKQHQWSGLQVVKDHGTQVVYTGFVLLILGLVITFYVRITKPENLDDRQESIDKKY
ncbi:MAG: cytochrome c biogenesis protein ResB [Candidatus Omnitrophota bacterium]